jgi:alanine-alpha-ketoisovalerate/valine-pyruvate aminotransferase
LVLVGNKVDLSDTGRVVNRERGQALADQWMCPFYETSAKNSINVDQVIILEKKFCQKFECILFRYLWIWLDKLIVEYHVSEKHHDK